MDNYEGTSNWFDEAIPIMPKTEGSGPEGTQELLSLGSPLLAALNLTPIGRGLTAAVATMATVPTESEAGVMSILGRTATKVTKGGKRIVNLIEDGAAVFPDMSRNVEFPTSSMAKQIAEGADFKTLAQSIEMPPNIGDLVMWDLSDVASAKARMERIPLEASTHTGMKVKHKIQSEGTQGFFRMPSSNLSEGEIVIRTQGRTPDEIAKTTTHEFTHGGDITDPIMEKVMRVGEEDLDYFLDLSESRAFGSGYRTGFDKTLTSPSSPDFLHPMLSYGGGIISHAPALDYINNLRHSYKAIGKDVDNEFIKSYMTEIFKEKAKMQKRINIDPIYRHKLDKATMDTTVSDAAWMFSNPQKVATLENTAENRIRIQKDAMLVRAAQYAIEGK